MLRMASSRMLARRGLLASPQMSGRPLTSSSALAVRIRSSNPNPNGDAPASGPAPPSPAERPPAPPAGTTTPKTFEPKVRNAGAGSTSTSTTGAPRLTRPITPAPATAATPAGASNIPLTPPSPPPPAGETPAEPEETVPFSKASLPSLDIDPDVAPAIAEPGEGASGDGSGGRRRTGAGRKEYVSSIERQRRLWVRIGLGLALVGGAGAAWQLGQGEPVEGENGVGAYVKRFKGNVSEVFDVFNKPAFKLLLPDPLPPPHQRPYTLVVDLEGLLVSSTWDRTSGWRTAKRPGVDYFLAYLSQFYEIVLFTSQPLYTAIAVAEKLDPFAAYIPYRLYRESTRHVNGKVVKDLSYLNRDLSKVVLLDINAEHAALQPENAIVIKPWEGKGGERGLIDLIPFLESIGIFNPPDVRPILKAYEGKDIPTEYAKKEAESKRVAVEEWERLHPQSAYSGGTGFLSGMFGSVASSGQPSRPNQPMTYLEQKRTQAQKMYQEEQKYWAEHADEFKKLIEEDKQRQMAEMKGSLWNYVSGQPSASAAAAAAATEEKK